jgi:hypothetical protein
MEAITTRALLLAAVGRATKHAGKTTLYLTTMHASRTALMRLIANIRAALSHVNRVAEQSPATDRWKTLLETTSWPESFRIGHENSSKHMPCWLATAVFRLISDLGHPPVAVSSEGGAVEEGEVEAGEAVHGLPQEGGGQNNLPNALNC